jgi:hypothetical protein
MRQDGRETNEARFIINGRRLNRSDFVLPERLADDIESG